MTSTMTSPVSTTADLSAEVHTALNAMAEAISKLPADDTLTTPKAFEANFVRRSTLTATIGRLRMELRHLQELEPQAVLLTDWITTLREAVADLEPRLAAAEDAGTTDTRAYRLTESLRHSLRVLTSGPEIVSGNEFLPDSLVSWFTDHHVAPLPGQRGPFSGRGGLQSAEKRLGSLLLEIAAARAVVDHTLTTAKQLV